MRGNPPTVLVLVLRFVLGVLCCGDDAAKLAASYQSFHHGSVLFRPRA
jgi:hypothetical protein